MITITVTRFFKGEDYTIGKLYLNGIYQCDTLEDHCRLITSYDPKVFGQTAIPSGTFTVTKEVNIKQGNCFRVHNVPYFEGILIHAGNTAADTHGCVLIGKNSVKGKVLNSKFELNRLYKAIPDKSKIILIIK